MKTKIKRHSRAVISVILAISMLVSCMMVGLIATDAARVTDSAVGAKTDDTEEAVGAKDEGETVGLDSGDGMYLGIGSANSMQWYGMGSNEKEIVLDSAKTIYFHFYVGGYKFAMGSTSTQPSEACTEDWILYAQKGASNNISASLPAGTYKFKLKGIKSSNANALEYQFWKVSGGSGGGDDPTPGGDVTEVTDTDLIAVLKREKIMFYHGDEWGTNTTKYLFKKNTTTQVSADAYEVTLFKKCYMGIACVPAGDYNISNNSTWSGNNVGTVAAGYMYCQYKGNYHSTGHLDNSTDAKVLWSKSSETVKYGATSSTISATKSGSTAYAALGNVKYYYQDGTKFYEFSPSNLPNLEPGTYNVYAAASDGKIYIAATSTGTLTVSPPLASELTLTASKTTLTEVEESTTLTANATDLQNVAVTYKLYKEGTATPIDTQSKAAGTTSATFTVTPNARSTTYYVTVSPTTGTAYDAVTSNSVTIANTADDYIPKYTVTFDSNNASYGTVTAKDGNGNAIESGASVKEGTSVIFTATPKAGQVFVNWTGIDSTASTVTCIIRADTTVQGVFGPKGYSVMAGNDNKVAMRELSNGTYISANSYAKSVHFQLYRNATGTKSISSETTQGVDPNGTKYKVTSWEISSTLEGNVFTTYDNQSGNRYIVYDPATDQVWLTADKDDLYDVKVVAKDGTIRYGHKTTSDYTQVFGDTTITAKDANGTTIAVHDAYDSMAQAVDLTANQVRNGVTLKIQTQTKTEYVKKGYYVKGFAVSGYEESFSVLWQEFEDDYADKAWIDSGYNEFELTIEGYPEKNIEITPIYWIKESTEGSNIRFYVDGFAGEVYKEWDGNLAVDAFNTSGNRIFGEYPGQPMINYNGRYVVDLPREGVTGITLNNYVWDRVHTNLFYGTSGTDNPTTGNGYLQKIQNANKQTYDFNDFVYLKQVNDVAGDDEDIIFSFRYKYDANHATTATSNLGKSTYYKDNSSSSATTNYDYRKDYSTINPNDSIYQWENLTDFYGNRVDIFNDYVDQTDTSGHSSNPKAAYTNPIRIVSNGYDYSEAGNYATAWAVYAPVDSTGNTLVPNGAYDHYALIDVFGGQGITTGNKWGSSSYLVNPTYTKNLRDKYDREYSQDSSKPHSGSNFVFDFAKMPTVISYEYTIKNNTSNLNLEHAGTQATDGNPGLRSDGRWYVSKSDQTLKSNVIIEYAEKDDDSLYHRDYFQANGVDYTSGNAYNPTLNTGLATGIKAYFDNDDASDEHALISYQNIPGNTQAYAVSDGEHTFNLTTVGDPNGDYTFKGWYLYSNGKYSLVSRDAIYPSEATANDVYVARYYKTPSGTLNVTHELHPDSTGKGTCYAKVEVMNGDTVKYTYNETTNPIKVTNTYMKSGSTDTLRITLRTVPGSLSTFEDFYKKLSDTIEKLSVSGVLAGVSIDKTDSQNLKATITTNAISNFFTDGEQTVKALPFYSKLNKQEYNYTIEYVYTSRLWGEQEYVQKGTIEDDILKYFDLSSDGSTCTLNNKLQEEFLSMMAPYENNFKEKVVWMFSDTSETPPQEDWLNGELTIRVESSRPAESRVFTNYYNLPYSTNLGNDKLVASMTDSSGRPKKDDSVPDQRFYATYGKRYTLDNVDSSENFIKAEPIINKGTDDSPDLEYFQYWNVYSADGSNRFIRKCYYNEFNLTFYEAYRIEAVYGSKPTTPSSQSKTDDIKASISFLENSRNQWNYNHGGTVDTVKSYWKLYGDRVFSDFALSFSYKDKMIKTVTSSNLKTQLVIEQLGNLSVKDPETGELDTKNNLPIPANDGTADLKTYIDSNTNTNNHKYIVQNIDKTELDNKNCIEYYYNFANVTQKNMKLEAYNEIKSTFVPTATDLRNHYYRAYAVITDGTDTVVSEPVYFTIYDMANIKNYSENAKADGGKS